LIATTKGRAKFSAPEKRIYSQRKPVFTCKACTTVLADPDRTERDTFSCLRLKKVRNEVVNSMKMVQINKKWTNVTLEY
jgi:hypothetical protein